MRFPHFLERHLPRLRSRRPLHGRRAAQRSVVALCLPVRLIAQSVRNRLSCSKCPTIESVQFTGCSKQKYSRGRKSSQTAALQNSRLIRTVPKAREMPKSTRSTSILCVHCSCCALRHLGSGRYLRLQTPDECRATFPATTHDHFAVSAL